jgi:NAD(P)-dependent dehydrogenase (short-subunit alcohol dehydrogenase family)
MNYLIIGATSGIGLATAKTLHQQGHTIFAVSRKENEELKNLNITQFIVDFSQKNLQLNFQIH